MGLSHICIIVDDLMEAFHYYKGLFDAEPVQSIPRWYNDGFAQTMGFSLCHSENPLSVGFLSLPNSDLILELIEYYDPNNAVSGYSGSSICKPKGGCHVALKTPDINSTLFEVARHNDVWLVNGSKISETKPEDFYNYVETADGSLQVKQDLHRFFYFYFIDRYGQMWEYVQESD